MQVKASTRTGDEVEAHLTPDGVPRLLTRTPPPRGMVAARNWTAAGNPVIPRADWPKLAFARHRSDVPILDQGNTGECNPHAWTSALMCARSAAGQAFQLLSPPSLYAYICGGRDQGSNISDGAEVVQKYGICLMADVPPGFYPSPSRLAAAAKQTALRFRVDPGDCYSFETFDEAVSAALLGHHFNLSVYVAGDWNRLDADGCPPAYRGAGNHAVMGGEGIVFTARGEPLIDMRNSWSERWGQAGRFRIREAHLAHQSYFEGYAIRWAAQDPDDPNLAPVAA